MNIIKASEAKTLLEDQLHVRRSLVLNRFEEDLKKLDSAITAAIKESIIVSENPVVNVSFTFTLPDGEELTNSELDALISYANDGIIKAGYSYASVDLEKMQNKHRWIMSISFSIEYELDWDDVYDEAAYD